MPVNTDKTSNPSGINAAKKNTGLIKATATFLFLDLSADFAAGSATDAELAFAVLAVLSILVRLGSISTLPNATNNSDR